MSDKLYPMPDDELRAVEFKIMDRLLNDELNQGAVRIQRIIMRIDELKATIAELRAALKEITKGDITGYQVDVPYLTALDMQDIAEQALDKTKDIK